MINGYSYNPPKDEAATIKWMKDLIEAIDMKILQGPFASYVTKEGNRGLTCVAMIETSHVALHVWDEEEPAFIQFDLYTCGRMAQGFIIDQIKDFMQVSDARYLTMDRAEGFQVIDEGFF